MASFSARNVVSGQVYPLPTLGRGIGEELKPTKVGRGGRVEPLAEGGMVKPTTVEPEVLAVVKCPVCV